MKKILYPALAAAATVAVMALPGTASNADPGTPAPVATENPAPVVPRAAVQQEDGRYDHPKVVWPLASKHVQIEGEGGWGIRRFANEVEQRVPGLDIHTRGTCADRPKAVCVRVVVGEWGPEEESYISGGINGWGALTTFPAPMQRTVWLNTTTKENRYANAVHEFGHVLGLPHHNKLGIDGRTPNVIHLSLSEKRALRRAY